MLNTIEKIKVRKSEIEQQILKILRAFAEEVDMNLRHVDVKVDHHSYEEDEEHRKYKKKLRKLKGVLDVNINMNLDNDPSSID